MTYDRTVTGITNRVRDRLGDSAAGIFDSQEMTRHLESAVMDYSTHRPYMKSTTIETVADQKLYDLPADCLYVSRVWLTDSEVSDYTNDILLDIRDHLYYLDEHRWREQLRERYANAGQPVAVEWNAQLYLYPAPSESGKTINVEYGAMHVASSGSYSTIALQDIRHVESLCLVRCLEALATDAAKRANYADGQTRVDNSQMASAFRKEAAAERAKVMDALSETIGCFA
jgi:hypothetical protein